MKIGYLNTLYSPHIGGGAEITLKSIVEGIHRKGHDVFVVTTGKENGIVKEVVDGIDVYRVGGTNIYWQFAREGKGKLDKAIWHLKDRYNQRALDLVREVIDAESPDVLSLHNLPGLSISMWDLADRAPIIQVLHDQYLLCPNTNMFKRGRVCQNQCFGCKGLRHNFPSASGKVAAVVGVSQFIVEKLAGNGYFSNSLKAVINNSREIPVDLVQPTHSRKAKVFGFIGTLSEAKGIEWLVNQFQGMPADAKLYIAGSGDSVYERGLKTANHHPQIHFLGYQKAQEFYSMIDVCVVPSIWSDTFPGVAFEAAARNIPVISSNRGGLPEIVKHEINGLLCDPNEPGSLYSAMQRIYDDTALFDKLRSAARASVSSLIDMDRMLSQYEQLYKTVTARVD